MRPNRRNVLAGLAATSTGLMTTRPADAIGVGPRISRGLYRPPGIPRLADDPITEFMVDAYHLDGSAYNVNQGAGGAPLWGLSLRGYPYRTQFAAFSPATTTAGQGCGFDGRSQYIYTTIAAGTGPWRSSPIQQTMLVVAQVNAQLPTAQTLMGIEGHAVPQRASLQIAANALGFSLNWVTNNTTIGVFAQSVVVGQPFSAVLTLDYAAGTANLFYDRSKSTIAGSARAPGQWDEANFANSVVAGVNKNTFLEGTVLFAATWNTILSDDVIFRTLENPFGFLVFPDDELMASLVGAATSRRASAHGFPR